MHKRTDFKPADPAWDAAEAQWMRELATGGAGAGAALASLFKAYGSLFVRRLVLLGLPESQAPEIAQELWLEIARAAPRYEGVVPVRAFFSGFVRTARMRYFSSRGEEPRFDSLADDAVTASAEAAMQAAASATMPFPERLDLLRCVRNAYAAFERKHPRMASLLMLRHVEELSLDEMAAALGGTAEQAKAELFSARRKFKPLVAPCLQLWPDGGDADVLPR